MQRQIHKTTFPTFVAVSLLAALSGCDPVPAECAPPPACMCNETTSTGDTTASAPECPAGGFKHISEKQCVACDSGAPVICADLKCSDAYGYEYKCCLDESSGNTVTCPS